MFNRDCSRVRACFRLRWSYHMTTFQCFYPVFHQITRFNQQRVLSLQSSLIQYVDARITNGRDTYAVLAKLLSDVKSI